MKDGTGQMLLPLQDCYDRHMQVSAEEAELIAKLREKQLKGIEKKQKVSENGKKVLYG